MDLLIPNYDRITALCASVKPREIFESAAKRHFQKFLWVLKPQ